MKRPAPSSHNQEADPKKKTKAEKAALKRQKGKGKGKGGVKRPPGNCPRETPDGKRICFGFNRKEGACARTKCGFLHVCGKCFKDHPMWRCNA